MDNNLVTIAKQFDERTVSVEFLTDCRNTIHKATTSDRSFILRLSPQNYRTKAQIESELDFQKYLFDNGADVVNPIYCTSGERCLTAENGETHAIVSAFEYANGKDWDERNDKLPDVMQNIGKALGKIHRLSKDYTPVGVVKRRLWSEQQELTRAHDVFKNHSSVLLRKYTDFMEEMANSEMTSDNFGLTHGDYLMSNYFIGENNALSVYDFDECEYSWFAADLAICMRCYLFWTMNPADLPNKADEAEMMHYNLLLGYSEENTVTEDMVFGLEKYIKIRDYIELVQLLTQGELNEIEQTLHDMILDRVLYGKPFLEFSKERAKTLLH